MHYSKQTEQLARMDAMYAAGNLTEEEYRGAAAIVVGGTIEQADRGGVDFAISGDFIARNRAMVALRQALDLN